jgi:site-specific DNA-methyltransferase (adenine-specific)
VELPYRLIQLYTFEGEVVLDPFMGSGATAVAAVQTERHFVGYDISAVYVKLAERRLLAATAQSKLALASVDDTSRPADLRNDRQLAL